MSTALTGTPRLLRATVRQDGRLLAPWILLTTALSASSVLIYPLVFPTQQDRAGLATAIGSNPALGLIFGPAYDLSTADGFNAWRSLALGGFLAALGMIFAVTRATRAQEDSGQAELLASGVLGRGARLMTAVSMCLAASVVLGIVTATVTVLCGGGWEPSLLLAATMSATGWMFTGVAAVTAQLASEARTANSLAVGTLGVLFLLRGFAYAVDAPEWTIWVNPLGWMTETKPAVDDRWWPLLPAVALTLVLLVLAFALQARRDFGGGAIGPRPGPARGRDRSVLRLVVRINRAPLITWTVAFIAIGFVFGYLATALTDILGSDSAVQQILAAGATSSSQLVSAFLVTILSLVGILASIPGVQVMLKVRAEEMADRLEPIIAARVRRPQYYASNVVIALLAPAVYVLVAGTLIGILASGADIGVQLGDVVLQALATVPAVWTVVALSVAVVGARPQVTLAAWAGVLISFVLTILGPTFRLWDWVLAISPFWHIPQVTSSDADPMGLLWISLVTLLFLVVGFAGFRNRDLVR
ncbi:ABC transporter permease [Microbacterium sp. Sa4CUA7]|uniref:ABC transporter permease n=1 Tax=Microbacterium pullorum TaxID=2762236 RepID=A0ABR8S3W4_9MICO|nr:ABC transporter permease [Microbacterium pullorum]MBD7958148.1 ABC transporter permease [Microbacterium pullorum]